MENQSIMALDERYVAHTYGRAPVVFARGEGCRLYDESGRAYIDMGAGIAVSALGYGDAGWVRAVSEQAAALSHASNLYHTAPQARLAQVLCQRSGLARAFFCNSGAEANECAIKVARKHAADRFGENRRPVIITLLDSFRGRTLATLAATGQERFHHDFGPFPEGFGHVPANDAAALEAALDRPDVCALMLETVQGEGGVVALDADYIRLARELTARRGQLLMIDEVQTGNGRTGKRFSYEHFGIQPDVVSTAKGLAGGLPMGACLMSDEAAQALTPGTHGSTFGGNPVCAAAALYVQQRLTDELLAEVAQKGAWIRAELSALPGVTVSGLGLMLGVHCGKDAAALAAALLRRGVVALTAKDRLRLTPPLTIPWDDLRTAVDIIKEEITA